MRVFLRLLLLNEVVTRACVSILYFILLNMLSWHHNPCVKLDFSKDSADRAPELIIRSCVFRSRTRQGKEQQKINWLPHKNSRLASPQWQQGPPFLPCVLNRDQMKAHKRLTLSRFQERPPFVSSHVSEGQLLCPMWNTEAQCPPALLELRI